MDQFDLVIMSENSAVTSGDNGTALRGKRPPAIREIVLAIGLGCLAFFSGCAVGPNYKRPATDSPGNFRNAAPVATTNSFADLLIGNCFSEGLRMGVSKGGYHVCPT